MQVRAAAPCLAIQFYFEIELVVIHTAKKGSFLVLVFAFSLWFL
jgi:hypothetical protein